MSAMMRKRQPKAKGDGLQKATAASQRHSITLAIMFVTVMTLCLSWGAIELESYANRHFDEQATFGTELTCFLTPVTCQYPHFRSCDKYILDIIHRYVVYYGVRLDCLISHPLFLISLWFHWKERFGKRMLYAALFLTIVKFVAVTSVFLCILMDAGSCMREIFEKAQFGSYESKILYSFAMVILSSLFDTLLFATLLMAYFQPKRSVATYQIGPSQVSGNMWSFNHHNVLKSVKHVIAKTRNAPGTSIIKTFPISDLEHCSSKSNPV